MLGVSLSGLDSVSVEAFGFLGLRFLRLLPVVSLLCPSSQDKVYTLYSNKSIVFAITKKMFLIIFEGLFGAAQQELGYAIQGEA